MRRSGEAVSASPSPFSYQMAKHKSNRVRLLTAYDEVLFKKRDVALDMVAKGEAVIIQLSPLIIKEARFLRYKQEARYQKGQIIPGVEHPDPRRTLPILGEDGKRHPDHASPVFAHKPQEGSEQGRCFPPGLIPEEIDYQRYRLNWLRTVSETRYARSCQQRQLSERYNRRLRRPQISRGKPQRTKP